MILAADWLGVFIREVQNRTCLQLRRSPVACVAVGAEWSGGVCVWARARARACVRARALGCVCVCLGEVFFLVL